MPLKSALTFQFIFDSNQPVISTRPEIRSDGINGRDGGFRVDILPWGRYIRYMSNYRSLEIGRFSEMFGALSSPHRLRILLRLTECCGPEMSCSTDAGMGACVGELSEGLGLAPSTVSHHLKELRRTGLISMTRQGRKVECTVNAEALQELTALIANGRYPRSELSSGMR